MPRAAEGASTTAERLAVGIFASIRRLMLPMALLSATSVAAASSREACPARGSEDYYFPAGTFAEGPRRDDAFVRRWFSEQLRAMGEPSLSCGTAGRVYRFTWLRSFDHPVAVRVTDSGSRGRLDAIELDGAGGYAPGKPLRRKSFVLGKKSMAKLRATMAAAWELSATEPSSGRDGAEWIIEVAEDGRHHAVLRWSPEQGPVRDLGLRLLSESGWKYHRHETY